MASGEQRSTWVDQARGWAILLIVVGHVLRGLVSAGLLSAQGWAQWVDAYLYSFHFHSFFVLSGLFAARAARRPTGPFFVNKLRTVVYPWFLWAALQTALQVVLSRHTNRRLTWDALLQIPLNPPMQFWFLKALFLNAAFHYLCVRARLPALGFLLVTVVLYAGWYGDFLPHLMVLRDVYQLSVYFAVGVALSPYLTGANGRAPRPADGALSPLLLVPIVAAYGAADSPWVSPFVALAGILGLLALSRGLAERPFLSFVTYAGERSLEIFVAHTLFSAATRIALVRAFHVEAAALYILLGCLMGLSGPLLMAAVAERLGFGFVFTLRLRKPAAPV